MSKVAIVGDASGTGTFTISAPNGNTDRTLVLTDEAGTIITTAGVPASAMPAGSVLQVQQVSSGTRVSTSNTYPTWAEPSTGYRVSITPQRSNSMVKLQYYIPINQSSAANILTVVRAFRIINGGSKSYALTSAGSANGTRNAVAGGVFRPGNGYDSNDMNMVTFTAIDFPATTLSCVYGFEMVPEGTATVRFGYSGVDTPSWGWDADIVITATEVAQ